MPTPALEPIQERVVVQVLAQLATISEGTTFWNTVPADRVYRWQRPKEGGDRYPYLEVADVAESVGEGPAGGEGPDYGLFSRELRIVLEGVLRASRLGTVSPQTEGWRLLADVEMALKANPHLETTPGVPSTRLATTVFVGQGVVVTGVPQEPLVTVSRAIIVRYRTPRLSPYAAR